MKLMAFQKMKIRKYIREHKALVGDEARLDHFEKCLIDMATESAHTTKKEYFIYKCAWCSKQIKISRSDTRNSVTHHHCNEKCERASFHSRESRLRWQEDDPILLNNERF